MVSTQEWAQAIAGRIADEWAGRDEFPQDAELLRRTLATVLGKHPRRCRALIGTGIIEAHHFEPLA